MSSKSENKERVNRQYAPEFRKKAVQLALTSGHPAVHVARMLGVNESTLASWVSLEKNTKKKAAEVNQATLESNAQGEMQLLNELEAQICVDIDQQKTSANKLMKAVIDKLKRENESLRQERDLLQHALSATMDGAFS